MTFSKLWKSCATPPASSPSASIFWACARAAASSPVRGCGTATGPAAWLLGGRASASSSLRCRVTEPAISAPPMRHSSAPPVMAARAAEAMWNAGSSASHSDVPSSDSDAASVSVKPTYNPRRGLRVLPLIFFVFMTPPHGPGNRRQVTYLNSNVTEVARCRSLESFESVTTRRQHAARRMPQHLRPAGLDVQQRTVRAAPQQPKVLRPSELAPVQRQAPRITRLRGSDNQKTVVNQCVVGQPHGSTGERPGNGTCEIRTACGRGTDDDGGSVRRVGPGGEGREPGERQCQQRPCPCP